MTNRPTDTITTSRADLAASLDALLAGFEAAYAAVDSSVRAHRDALRAADPKGIDAALHRQSSSLRDLAACDQRRREVLAGVCGRLPELAGKKPDAITLTDLARACPAEQRPRMESRAAALRTLAINVREQTASTRAATQTLLAHMEGMMRQVGRTLSHAGTYGRGGVVEPVAGIGGVALDLAT
ncbi:MAG TPA: flagellar protein FlgN [Phycisphaerales bacterium]|nr:flagellar protein FlgN [Phycisphaerales bacterium]